MIHERVSRQKEWLGSTLAGFLCRLSLRESTSFRGAKCDFSRPEGRRPQSRGLRAGGSPAIANSTPGTQTFLPAKAHKLNHAQKRDRFSNAKTSLPGSLG